MDDLKLSPSLFSLLEPSHLTNFKRRCGWSLCLPRAHNTFFSSQNINVIVFYSGAHVMETVTSTSQLQKVTRQRDRI
jgi:hypothetical protein